MSQSIRQKLKILIVDDVDSNRFILRDIITEMGYMPILAENGVQALKVVERLSPQLIISDVAMPEMDGYELCRQLKKDAKYKDIPVIFISAYDNPEDVVKGFEIGGEDYITKPFIPEVVKARVGLRLKLYEANWELADSNRHLQTSVGEQLHQLEMEKKNVLYALTRVAKSCVTYNQEYMERVIKNAKTLAEAMQLSEQFSGRISDAFIDTIPLAIPLGDIGKVSVPTHILLHRENLSPEEREILRNHTKVGANILKDVQVTGDYNDFLQMSYDIALCHHERWDGSGYPYNKQGNEIPLSAQILSVIGRFCTLTEQRIETPAISKEAAILQIEQEAGSAFHPEIVAILKMIARQLQ